MSLIYQNGLTFGLGAAYDLFAQTVGSSVSKQHTPHHLVIVQNDGSRPIYLGSELQVGANPGILEHGYKLDPGETFRLELMHDRLWAANDDVASVSGIRVTVVVF